MASVAFQQNRFPTDEVQTFIATANQGYQQPTAFVVDDGWKPPSAPPPFFRQEAPQQRQSEFSRQVSLRRVFSYVDRRNRKSCIDSLQRILFWVVTNAVLTCALVIGLLFLLKYLDSPLLLSEGRNGTGEGLLTANSAQKTCRPCEENSDESSSKQSNCCTTDHEALRRLVEKITKETISAQLPVISQQRNVSGGSHQLTPGGTASAALDRCGALFFLEDDVNPPLTTTSQQAHTYSILRGWDAEGYNVAYRKNCIGYNNLTGEVTISQSGLYVVYSHLAFKWKNYTDLSSRPSIALGQEIRVEIAKDVKTKLAIAKDTRAIQPSDPKVGVIPSYNSRTMSIVQLNSGAKLTVHAKPSDLVIRKNAVSSFGLFRL